MLGYLDLIGKYAQEYISYKPEKAKSLGTSFSCQDAELKSEIVFLSTK